MERPEAIGLEGCAPGEGFVKVEKVLLPDSSVAVWANTTTSRANCEKQCKSNCSCSAYAIVDAPGRAKGCVTWYGELMDATYDRNDRYDLYVRVDALELADKSRKSNGSLEKELLTILVPAVVSTWLIISIFRSVWLRKRGEKKYAEFGKISVKSDVFSFGVMLLEIVSGKRNSEFTTKDDSLTLIGHVRDF
ncbi:unnamed protein product [Dovyalis caffra]|uniref:Apple domain-containing protein n=1 Tax=Dovyalis caffra TaxID=77055 RepID=A0AAV1SH38_9ROSI|nr:unnamed protein product [Dovyalis caffra]